MKKVVVGMSGGVDSSVAALLLKQQGYEVIGLFMKNWEEEDSSGHCHAEKDFEDVTRVCEILDIPYYGINFVKEYQERVFASFLEEIKLGFTPNPDILCNREIKFDCFLKKALSLGADYLATGHYCQTDGEKLLRGADSNKDQSYFLYTLKREKLPKILFPIGHLPKAEVRRIAREHNLPVATKKDSTGICFIGKRPFKEFLQKYITDEPGPFLTPEGTQVGEHDGICFYTIGQRKGLCLGGPGEPWYVVGKKENAVIVAQGENHPALFADGLLAKDITWIGDKGPKRCSAKIRYRSPDAPCTLEETDEGLYVHFDSPQRAITPRQSIVFYDGDVCLGGAIIHQPVVSCASVP
ncbi:MAG: tRNA 2-thiouridine(34) synthase MnmA [Chlamydiia bacterium]|nr:tRNA 2-thiouridine(34) synthase MnmA [Chlamydiia bacterium]MCP5510230.1 tRNA 2-thiouridine(34) synthase MnmA [Chlamydiales bacterium]HPE84665.1 tRNA 2-thiouridine(34) synthase MnmA [Chlamydiales bacterium]